LPVASKQVLRPIELVSNHFLSHPGLIVQFIQDYLQYIINKKAGKNGYAVEHDNSTLLQATGFYAVILAF
jgi:hypothetical protein